jgi:predicted signal transduction protein with EAL and GGDEF domain
MNDADSQPNRRILIVDDNPTIHEDFQKILCPANNRRPEVSRLAAALFDEAEPAVQTIRFELDSAYQGQEGFEMVKKAVAENRPYAMAFVDVRMPPGWDGVETIARLWEVYPRLQIVVCTAYSDYSWEDLLAKVGQSDSLVILKKPCDNVEVQQLALALTKKWLLNVQADFKLADLEAEVALRTEELVEANNSLVHDAFHDCLTSLPNRALFIDRLERTVARAKRHTDYKFAVLFIDIDRFKIVNDSLGHHAGDELIIQFSKRVLHSLRLEDVISRPVNPYILVNEWTTKDDTLARLGGDEFTVLLDDLRSSTDSIRVASRIQQALAEPFVIAGQEVFTTASIGIAASSQSYTCAADVLRDADIAMYRAKAQGKARCEVFDQATHDQAVGRLKLETDLRRALDRDEFRVYYQPIVSLDSGNIAGFEALVRWDRPGVGIVLPAEFIAIAEEIGLIVFLGNWVLRKACEQAHRWHLASPGDPLLTMSVNVSGRQFKQTDIVEEVEKILRDTRVDPTTIKLEITETVAMDNAERTIRVVKGLKNLGVRLSIDDFGTGYSSLSYLRRFPMDTLKIDRSFVKNLPSNQENLEIVRTIMSLARNLGMDVVAEGTETAEEIEQLKALECDFGQGYFFSKPVDSGQADNLLGAWQAHQRLLA